MAATSTVLYPRGARFDLDYYINRHMPFVLEEWTMYGLKSWKVLQFQDVEAPYSIQATLEWVDMDGLQDALLSLSAQDVFGDVKNFSDRKPLFFTGNVVALS